jgi:hypothetical protein
MFWYMLASDFEPRVYGAARLAAMAGYRRKKTRLAEPVGFKSILFGRLEETDQTIATRFGGVRFPLVMPDINLVNG